MPRKTSFGLLRAFSTPKDPGILNEDAWSASADGTVAALSDGATISFDSRTWANLLVRKFVSDQNVNATWLRETLAEFEATFERDKLSWSMQAAFDRGSFATFTGIVCNHEGRGAQVLAVGDTLAVFVDEGRIVRCHPYSNADEFDSAPALLSTALCENTYKHDDDFMHAWIEMNFAGHSDPAILLLTDAVGKWLLEDKSEERLSLLLGVKHEEDFVAFVECEREHGRMRKDDSTLLYFGGID